MEVLVGTEGNGDVLEKAGGRMRDMGFRRCTREREIEKARRVGPVLNCRDSTHTGVSM